MSDYDAIVIGSGAGGLTAAVALARLGKKVAVFEQHYLPGGWCHSFPLEGFKFSPGVHYIGQCNEGGQMRRIWEGLGVADDIVMLELARDGFDHVRIGDERFDIPAGKEVYRARLKERFPSEGGAIDTWLDTCHRLHTELESGTRVRNLREMLTLPWRLRTTIRHGLRSTGAFLDGLTDDKLLKAILTMQAGDHGMSPEHAPLALHAAVVGHYFDGGWYPMGGGRAIPKALIRGLQRHGGSIEVRTPVDAILFEGEGRSQRAVGVRLHDGTEVSAPLVISNADPGVTFDGLVGRERLPRSIRRRLDRTTWSLSALSLFFAVDMDLEAAGLDSGNVWFTRTPDIDATYRLSTRESLVGLDEVPGVFLTVTTLKDRVKRKDGLHTCESFCFVSWDAFRQWAHSEFGDRPDDYERMKEHLTGVMFDALEEIVPGIREHTVFHSLGTPLTNQYYVNSTRGNLYGIEKRRFQVGPFSWPVDTGIDGLMMVGASTLGHGVAGATISGLAAAGKATGAGRRELLGGKSTLTTLPADHPEQWPEPWRSRADRAADAA